MRVFKARDITIPLDRTVVMGILNATPDSFSDGGQHNDVRSAVRHAELMLEQGADIIDIGGQSTRPGFTKIPSEEETVRIRDIVREVSRLGAVVSVDTFYPETARAALENGAHIINDVTGFANPGMTRVALEYSAGCVVMHDADITQERDAVRCICDFFASKTDELLSKGISPERICLDPGVGFGKTYEQNLILLKSYREFSKLGFPTLAAASRKRVVGIPCGNPPFDERDCATAAAHTIAICGGADIIRVHDVKNGVYAARVADAVIFSGKE